MVTGFWPEQKAKEGLHSWSTRNQARLLAIDVVCLTLLFSCYLFASRFPILSGDVLAGLYVASFALVFPIFLSVVFRGILPMIICILGIVLILNSVMLPFYAPGPPSEVNIGGRTFMYPAYTPQAVEIASGMHFFLGVLMVGFSIVVAYRPALMFTKNRPVSPEVEWSNYPIWHDNVLLADGRSEPSVPIKSLITDQDRYLLWRYEYVLANIYGTDYLVNPEGLVPKDSTVAVRDRASGRIVGKARYNGFFM